jgi:hypothetical protein
MSTFGLASHLKAFPSNEIKKGQYTMQLKKLEEASKEMKWPVSNDHLPVVSWEDCTLSSSLPLDDLVRSPADRLSLSLLSLLQSRRSPSLDPSWLSTVSSTIALRSLMSVSSLPYVVSSSPISLGS